MVGRSNFIKAFNAFDTNAQQKKLGDDFLAALPEQTRREFQAIQKLHGAYPGNTQALRTADNNFVSMGQVDVALSAATVAAMHKNDASIRAGIYNNMVDGRITTNANALFTKNQTVWYDGSLTDEANVRNSAGQVLAMKQPEIARMAVGAIKQREINAVEKSIREQAQNNTDPAWADPNSAVTRFLGKEIPTQTYRVPITTWKDEWNLFGTLRVIDKTEWVTVTDKNEAKRLLTLEQKKRKRSHRCSRCCDKAWKYHFPSH